MRMGLRTALAVMLMVVVACPALAQQSVDGKTDKDYSFLRIGGMSPTDSTKRMLRTDASGVLYTQDYARDRDLALDDDTPIISTSLTEVGDADSSVVLDLSGYALTGLAFMASGSADLLVQVRYCHEGVDDSTHTFPVVLARQDSIGSGIVVDRITSTTTVGSGTEFMVRLNALGVNGPLRRALIPLARLMETPRLDAVSVRIRLAVTEDGTNPNVIAVYAVGSALR